jgi:transcriptional antiterminator RfaH
MNMNSARWYVVQTKPHAETRAHEHLRRQGFTTYLPKVIKARCHARKIEQVSRPLFPRYMFVLVDATCQRGRAIRSNVGVIALIGGENGPTPMQPGIVEALRQQDDLDGFFRTKAAAFAPGAAVRVMDGFFTSCLGFFETMSDSQRVSVLLDILGGRVRVILDAQSVPAV